MMIITILWEDERGVASKSFGPGELLIACVADDLDRPRWEFKEQIQSVPLKGNGNVVRDLERHRDRWGGPICAVLDRDKAQELLGADAACLTALRLALADRASGNYQVVFLEENTETLIDIACDAMKVPRLTRKPTPDKRDTILNKAASQDTIRQTLRHNVPSFERLVSWVVSELSL